jgi:hypothetical protein
MSRILYRHSTHRLARKAIRAAVAMTLAVPLVIAVAGVVPGSPASAGTPPTILDDNRGTVTGFNLVNSLGPLFDGLPLNLSLPEPFGISLPPGPLLTQDDQGSRVLANPEIVNLYYDGNWDADNPYAPTSEQIDQWTKDLVGSSYLDAAGQYGVGAASFKGSDQANGASGTFCGTPASSGDVSLVTITGWVSCEAGYGRILTQGDPLTGVPGPDKNTLYVVYIPPTRNVSESSDCSKFGGLHFFSAAYATIVRFPAVLPVDQNYPFAVVDANCQLAHRADPPGPGNAVNFSGLQAAASHEILEASTNPFLFDGWINNGALDLSNFNVSTFFNDVTQLFNDGEAADICEEGLTTPPNTPPTYLHPTPAVTLPVNDPSMGNVITVAPYWSNADNQCVPTVPTTTSVITTPGSPSVFGQPITLTATVATTPPGGTPTGTVDFYDGSSKLGSATLAPGSSGAEATFTTASLAVGDHPAITAMYDGQGAYLTSTSPPADQLVNPAATNVTVSGLPNPSVFGQPVTFTATVSPAAPSTAPPAQPSGTVQFFDGSTLIGTAPLGQSSPDQATFSTALLAVGDHPAITAQYLGDTNFLGATSSADDQQVSQAPTATSVTGSPDPSTWGQPVTFTAVVAPSPPGTNPPQPPSGTITFSINGTAVATEPVTPGSPTSTDGQASFTTSGLLPGSQDVVASYSGDGNFLNSTSGTDQQQVNCTSNATSTSGSVKGLPAGSMCVTGVHVGGSVIVGAGQMVFISNSTIGGAVTANGPALFGLCHSTVGGAVTVRDATGFVVIGDPGDDGCPGNSIDDGVVLQSNHGDAEAWSNSITGSLVVHGTTGTGPFPDDTSTEVADNNVSATIDCQGNTPAPTSDGQLNHAASTTGQCAGF